MVWIQANSSEKDVNENNQVDRYWSSLCDRSLSFHVNVRIQTLTSLLMHKDSCHFWKCGLQSFIESMVCLRMSSIFILQQDQTLYEVFYSCIKLLPNSSLFMKERNVVWISVVFYFQYSRCSMSGNFDRALIWRAGTHWSWSGIEVLTPGFTSHSHKLSVTVNLSNHWT